jgi:hypothetical protein
MASELQEALQEKLNRSKEHIDQFKLESELFLNEAPQRTLVGNDPDVEKAIREFCKSRVVPKRLSIIAAESIQQIRSCLDHIICGLISIDGGTPDRRSQFPVTSYRPATKDHLASYNRQIKGITRVPVLTIIERYQPYQVGPRFGGHWLQILKDFSDRDKHRSLLLHVANVRPFTQVTIDSSKPAPEGAEASFFDPTVGSQPVAIVDMKPGLALHVTFDKWGDTAQVMTVEAGLVVLTTYVRNVLRELLRFAR